MGGEHGHGAEGGDFNAKVGSMPGGPTCRPKHWRRNTAIAMAGLFLVGLPIALKSAEFVYWKRVALRLNEQNDDRQTP